MRGPSAVFDFPAALRDTEEGEEWAEINGYGDYYVSDQGRVYSSKGQGKMLSQYTNESGAYSVVGLYDDGDRKQRLVHSLVMEHFRPDRWEEYLAGEVEIHHLDDDGRNNAAENLRYVTREENEQAKHAEEPEDSVFSPTEAAPF